MDKFLVIAESLLRGLSKFVLAVFLYGGALGVLGAGLGVAGALYYMDGLLEELPEPEELYLQRPSETTKIYASNGELLGELFLEHRYYLNIEEVPDTLKKAFLAIEDTEFYTHRGIRVASLVRAAMAIKREGKLTQGGSTITMQITRDLFLTKEKSFKRKLKEILIALMLEQRYSKDEIFEMYLNKIYFGEYAYGVYTASQTYFGKKLKDLTIGESAMLAGLVQRPLDHSPYRNMDQAIGRRKLVLGRMLKVGFINQGEYEEAMNEPIKLRYKGIPPPPSLERLKFPHFTYYVLQQLLDTYGKEAVYGGGMKVYTSLDIEKQLAAEKAVKEGITKASKWHRVSEGALVSLEVGTGKVVAMVGGMDFMNSKFNRATQAKRQPGSSFKPIVYAAACEAGHNMSSRVLDAPVKIPLGGGQFYIPKNSGGKFSGNITLRRALQNSVNVAAVKTAQAIGVNKVVQMARRFGITAELPEFLSLALGSIEVVPLEMAASFAVFPQQGEYVKPTPITKIEDRVGRLLWTAEEQDRHPALSAKCAYSLADTMRDVIRAGTARSAQFGRRKYISGKTGTTSDYKDAWFVGFSKHLVTAVWVGNDSGQVMRRVFGGTVPAPIWKNYMEAALKKRGDDPFDEPTGITKADLGFGRGEQLGITRRSRSRDDNADEEREKRPTSEDGYFNDFKEPEREGDRAWPKPEGDTTSPPVDAGGGGTGTAPSDPVPPEGTPAEPQKPPSEPAVTPQPPPAKEPTPKPSIPTVDFESDDGAW